MAMRILRIRQNTVVSVDGTQYIDNGAVLSFSGAMTVRLAPTVFHNGKYVLFDYSDGSFPNKEELANITVDCSLLSAVTGTTVTGTLFDDVSSSRIILTLDGGFDQSVQYCEADLIFPASGTSTISLDDKLFNGAGEYVIFNVVGTVSNLDNVVVSPVKADLRAGKLYTKNGATTGNIYCTLSAATTPSLN